MEFYGVDIPLEAQPMLVLSVEKEELGIGAGLQDRVIQVYEGLVYMDFDKATNISSEV
jgi:glucuronokinase